MQESTSLDDRHVIVTGASRGLGRAMVLGLLRAGASVTFVSAGPSVALDATLALAAAIAPPSRFLAAFGDLRDPDACGRVARVAADGLGPVDVLFNNAAIPNAGEGEPFWGITDEDWVKICRTNCDTVFYMCRTIAPKMLARGSGKIVNISTSDRTMARPRFTPYGPSKAFVEACSRAWAGELEGTGVTMNVLCPGGVVDTAADVTGVATPGKRFLPASVMVPPVVWLASEGSNGVNGQRFIASLWDEKLDIEARVAAARQSGADAPRIM